MATLLNKEYGWYSWYAPPGGGSGMEKYSPCALNALFLTLHHIKGHKRFVKLQWVCGMPHRG